MKKVAIGLLNHGFCSFWWYYEDGLKAYNASNYKQSLALYSRAREYSGTGVKKDYKKAVALF